jgi:hypothetical protein
MTTLLPCREVSLTGFLHIGVDPRSKSSRCSIVLAKEGLQA